MFPRRIRAKIDVCVRWDRRLPCFPLLFWCVIAAGWEYAASREELYGCDPIKQQGDAVRDASISASIKCYATVVSRAWLYVCVCVCVSHVTAGGTRATNARALTGAVKKCASPV